MLCKCMTVVRHASLARSSSKANAKRARVCEIPGACVLENGAVSTTTNQASGTWEAADHALLAHLGDLLNALGTHDLPSLSIFLSP